MFQCVFLALLATLAPAAQADIQQLPDHASALAWVEKWEAQNARQTGTSPRGVYAVSDARYTGIKKALDAVWAGFRTSYPAETRGLEQAPYPVLVEDADVINAYAVYDAVSGELPFLFVIHTSALKASEPEQLGLYAHELAHLVFRHNVPGKAEAMRKFYTVAKGAPEPLGFLQKNEPRLQKDVAAYLKLVGDVGPVADESLGGLIMDPVGESNYAPLQKFLLRKYVHLNQDAACAKISPAFQRLMAAAAERIRPGLPTLSRGENLAPLSGEVLGHFQNCAKGANPGLVALFSESSGLSKEQVTQLVPAADIQAFDSAGSVVEGLLAITRHRHQQMRAIAKKRDLSRVRIFSEEEQADDAGARVLMGMGLTPKGLSDFLLNWLGGSDYRKACEETISAGKVPEYGALTHLHHETCYRVFHLGKLEEYLQKQ